MRLTQSLLKNLACLLACLLRHSRVVHYRDFSAPERMLRFTRHYKDTNQKRLAILIFITNLLQYTYAKNYENIAWFDKVIAKIKWCSFFDSQCIAGAQHVTRRYNEAVQCTYCVVSKPSRQSSVRMDLTWTSDDVVSRRHSPAAKVTPCLVCYLWTVRLLSEQLAASPRHHSCRISSRRCRPVAL